MGKFDDLVVKISQDPAMLVWLDNSTNPGRAGPTRTTRRELMELFTIGIDHYTQTDVTEVARALTGWTRPGLQPRHRIQRGDVRRTSRAHTTTGSKTILGQTGNFDGIRRDRHHPELTRLSRLGLGTLPGRRSSGPSSRDDDPPDYHRRRAPVRLRLLRTARSARSSGRSSSTPSSTSAHTRKTWVRSPVEYAVASVRMLEGTSDFSVGRQLPGRDGADPLQPLRREGLGLGDLAG